MHRQEVYYLLKQYISNQLTYKEEAKLKLVLDDPAYNELLVEVLHDLALMQPQLEAYREEHWQDMIASITRQSVKASATRSIAKRFVVWSAAAAVLAALVVLLLFKKQDATPSGKQAAIAMAKDIMPGTDKAILTLADGSRVVLDEHGHRTLLQGGVALTQQGGQLRYDVNNSANSLQYNTLATPKGGQFQLVLPDGSKVWLNAASTLTFPTAFSGSDRQVVLSGEAYFEITSNASKPFYIKTGDNVNIKVLGTGFNVNAYQNESALRTTLLQGAISVTASLSGNEQTVLLKPLQQAQVSREENGSRHSPDKITVNNNIDVNTVVAWKNGAFNLEGSNLREVMRQLERWYDIEVTYEGNVPDIMFAGKISRRVKLSSVLHALEEWGVNFRMDGERHLVVLP